MSKTLRDMQYKFDEIKKENERLKKISILYYKELSKNEKAAEYIEQVNKDKDQVPYLTECETLKLLNILRGEDNE